MLELGFLTYKFSKEWGTLWIRSLLDSYRFFYSLGVWPEKTETRWFLHVEVCGLSSESSHIFSCQT